MKILLDTHVFLWYISADPQLPIAFRNAIRDPFDRLLIAQSLQHGLLLATVDDAVRAYSIPLLSTV